MTIGVNCVAKDIYYVVIRSTEPEVDLEIGRLAYDVSSGNGLSHLYDSALTVGRKLKADHPDASFHLLLSQASSGAVKGSGTETLKAEAILELAFLAAGTGLSRTAPQALRHRLKCDKGDKWQDKISGLAKQVTKKWPYWSKGLQGAVAVAWPAE